MIASPTRRRRTALAVLALAVPLAACNADGPDAYTAPPAADSPEPDSTVPDSTGPETTAPDSTAPDSTGPTDASVPATGEVVDVRALDNTFIDEEVEIAAGTEVHWENRGRNDHDVIPVAEGEDWGVEIEEFTPGDSYSHVFTTPGTYRYYCTIHGTPDVGMIGTIVVT